MRYGVARKRYLAVRTLILAVALSATVVAQERAKPLQIDFTPSADSFAAATQEYRDLWAAEGERITTTMERMTALRFEAGRIRAVIYEGPSFSGYRERPMQLRASYSSATKRATLVHELGHRLMGDLVPSNVDHHSIIFLFVYDVWTELWGPSFADEQVKIERARTGALANYDKLWTDALAFSATERARRFKEFVQDHRK